MADRGAHAVHGASGGPGGALHAQKSFLQDAFNTLSVIALMVITPAFVLSLWYTCYHLNGSYLELFHFITNVRAPLCRRTHARPSASRPPARGEGGGPICG